MAPKEFLFTSESVSEGHPDKVADQISDAILDELLKQDPSSRVACETLVKTGLVLLAGEISSKCVPDYSEIARSVLRDIGYVGLEAGFDAESVAVLPNINAQSADIAQGVNEQQGTYEEQGAGDQGLMFGFACDETPELMPLPISLSHKILKELAEQRKDKKAEFLLPDSKSQVTVRYQDGKPVGVDAVVVSTQHKAQASLDEITSYVIEEVVKKVVPADLLDSNTRFFINPTGQFIIGGPQADAGLTGRKIIVDTYGGYSRHGGGAFSGKDPSKVDRSAAYLARYLAKNVVAAGLASKCEIQLAYAIGVAEPVSVYVDTFGTGKVEESKISSALTEAVDMRPRGLIERLGLLKPIYRQTAAYGHFGREAASDGSFSWEGTDLAESLKSL